MNKRTARLLSLLLAFLIPCFSACSETGKTGESGTADAAKTDAAAEDESVPSPEAPVPGRRTVVAGRSFERELTAEETKNYPQATNLPALYIRLNGRSTKSAIRNHIPTGARYTLVNNGTGIVDMPLEIEGRGNMSWALEQKAYTLTLRDAVPLLGMDPGRKWVLITTWSDKTLLRSYITLNLASELLGMDNACQTRYCDVFINGEYTGLYVLSEKITLGGARVDADALFECEAAYRHGDHKWCIICPSGCHILFKEPFDETLPAAEKEALYKEYKQLLVKADVAMTKGIDVYSRYIDVDSFADWYIVNEFAKNYDSGFTTSCYCYAKDGKIYMGPCWDYDTCWGNQNVATCLYPEGYHVADSPWYSILTSDEGFRAALHKRWTRLTDDGVIQAFLDMIDEQLENIAASEKLDHKIYPSAMTYTGLRGNLSKYTYKEEVDYLKKWVRSRIEWLNGEWYEKP